MWARIPIGGWVLGFIANAVLAVPLYFLWNYIAPKYLYQIPLLYQHISWIDMTLIAMLVSILKTVFLKGIFGSRMTNNINKKKK